MSDPRDERVEPEQQEDDASDQGATDKDEVQEQSEDSFPASDPPAF